MSPPLVALVAEGPYVVMALAETVAEPGGPGSYVTTHFNLFRIENGRLAEHWHSVQAAPGPNVPRPEDGGPQPVTGRSAIMAAGRSGLAAHFSARPERPIAVALEDPLVAMVAEGDLVVQVRMRQHVHPSRAGDTYTTTSFDMFRLADGWLVEHWDAAIKPSPTR